MSEVNPYQGRQYTVVPTDRLHMREREKEGEIKSETETGRDRERRRQRKGGEEDTKRRL